MKGTKRFKRRIWYAPCVGKTVVNHEPVPVYGPPVKLKANVSPASGVAQTEIFGVNTVFDRVIYIDHPCVEITETTVFCIDRPPSFDADRLIYDYRVTGIADGLTNTLVAVKKV